MIKNKKIFSDLTDRQLQVFSIIYDYYRQTGFYPTFREIAKMDGSSSGNIQHIVKILREKNYLEPSGIKIKKELFEI